MEVTATRGIQAGEELLLSYGAPASWGGACSCLCPAGEPAGSGSWASPLQGQLFSAFQAQLLACDPCVSPNAFSVAPCRPAPATCAAGERSDDSFFQHYGFVPPRNPHNDVTLFDSIAEAVAWFSAALAGQVRSVWECSARTVDGTSCCL